MNEYDKVRARILKAMGESPNKLIILGTSPTPGCIMDRLFRNEFHTENVIHTRNSYIDGQGRVI
jgi:hypothetical protein